MRQFRPSLRVSKVQEFKNNRFLVIGDTPREVAILQSDNKMKACLGQNVSASLPKAYQTSKAASKTLVVEFFPPYSWPSINWIVVYTTYIYRGAY